MMSYQSVDLKEDSEEISANQYLRESVSTDNETLDLAQVINQSPHSNSNNHIIAREDQWELTPINSPHFKILISPERALNMDILLLQISS